MSSIGIMDEGYFVSRRQIFKWIKSSLNIEITTLEQLGKGDIYCSLLNYFHPGCIPMSKIARNPRRHHQFLLNLKHLQNAIDKLGIERKIDIAKIAKCKPLDNLEFSQWLKRILQKDADKLAMSQLSTSMCRSSVGGTVTQRLERKSMGMIQERFSTNSNHTIRKYRQSIQVSCYNVDRMDTNDTMNKPKWLQLSNKNDTPVKKTIPPLKDKPVLVPSLKMRCVEALLSDQSTTDQQKLGYLRNLILGKCEEVKELVIE